MSTVAGTETMVWMRRTRWLLIARKLCLEESGSALVSSCSEPARQIVRCCSTTVVERRPMCRSWTVSAWRRFSRCWRACTPLARRCTGAIPAGAHTVGACTRTRLARLYTSTTPRTEFLEQPQARALSFKRVSVRVQVTAWAIRATRQATAAVKTWKCARRTKQANFVPT